MKFITEQLALPVKLAWQSLWIHKGRTALTVLGIIIGIAAVIIVMSAGQSVKGLMLAEFESFGTDFVQIEIKAPSAGRNSVESATSLAQGVEITTLTLDDAKEIGKLANVKSVASGIMGQDNVSYLAENKTITFLAGTPLIVDIMGVEIERGRTYTDEEDDNLAKVVVLGSKLATDLFGNQDPIGKSVKIGRSKFKVIGVSLERGVSLGFDYDNLVYLPLQTAQKLIMGVDHVVFITTKLHDPDIQEQTAEEIIALMRDRHDTSNIQEDDFAVTTAKETFEIIDAIFDGITLLIVAIAGISLLVGGVGIMNIMYVSVTERTFEIGLRKAIGARRSEILWQFLWEAIVVTLFGGALGVVIGAIMTFLVSVGASFAGFDWDFILPIESVIISFLFSGVVGIIFGYYPARRAAAMDPIVALRYEK
jgi:putative ABC transport system permease protein